MTTTLTHTQTRSISSGTFNVADVVSASSGGIGTEVFVYDTQTQTFNRFATAQDMYTYPVGHAAAVTANKDFYRQATATRAFQSLTDASAYASEVSGALKSLCTTFDSGTNAFVGSNTEVITS